MRSKSSKNIAFTIYSLERSVEFDIVLSPNDEVSHIRIEFLRKISSKDKYRVRIFRADTFRIRPTFPQIKGRPQYKLCDEMLWVEDTFLWPPDRQISALNVNSAVKKVLKVVRAKVTGKR